MQVGHGLILEFEKRVHILDRLLELGDALVRVAHDQSDRREMTIRIDLFIVPLFAVGLFCGIVLSHARSGPIPQIV